MRGIPAEAGDLRRAAELIAALEPSQASQLVKRARRDSLQHPGIAPPVAWRLREIALGGRDVALSAAREGLPALLRRLLELSVITTREGVLLVQRLGVLTLADMERALDGGRLARAIGEPAARLVAGLDALSLELPLLPLGRALDLMESVTPVLASTGVVDRLEAGGDVRRFEPLVRDFVIVASAADPAAALDVICRSSPVDDVLHRSARRAVLRHQHLEIDVRVALPDEYGTVLFAATGSQAHVAAVSARRGPLQSCASEEEVYRRAGLVWVPPEMRHASGEIEAAAAGSLPSLIEKGHIRGDLHVHSTYSDGRDAIETSVRTAAALGYEYIAITDHSQSAAASRNLTLDEIAPQREEIARVQKRFPGITILHGVEVDILPDGTLDFDDAVLERFDVVLASLHESARQDGPTLTRRCIKAIRHPLVNIITHPANQLVGRRPGFPLDFAAIYAAAAETGTALEVDGAATHLDLDGEHAREAIAAGVTLTIDSDCHRAAWLDRQMTMGIGTARRGWVEPRHVLNTRPVDDVRAFVAAKRRARG